MKTFPPISSLTSFNVLAKKSLTIFFFNNDSNRIQAQERENILKKYPDAVIVDVTSQATDGLVRLSPFYPHGRIPVPFSEGYTAMCVCLPSSTTKARAPQLLQLGKLMMKNVGG